jgi:hypothetical protein
MAAAKLRLAMSAMGQRKTVVSELCRELGVPTRPFTAISGPVAHYARMDKKILLRVYPTLKLVAN